MVQPDDPRGSLVRPYAVTRGRTEARREIAVEAILTASVANVQEARFAGHDKHRIASLCESNAMSLAEIAAYARLPLGVARVIVADMVVDGLLTLHSAAPVEAYEERMDLLERVLSGLRRL
ncbi:DUF742 domain-containing protein [Catenuloplanes sp. NPDC051500]|uniref:DUF742 domain-containing protein n=1 Tax=Catenuloplanes sp. NPDC051500 TaxID=3363959 RepID=UPI0037BA016C